MDGKSTTIPALPLRNTIALPLPLHGSKYRVSKVVVRRRVGIRTPDCQWSRFWRDTSCSKPLNHRSILFESSDDNVPKTPVPFNSESVGKVKSSRLLTYRTRGCTTSENLYSYCRDSRNTRLLSKACRNLFAESKALFVFRGGRVVKASRLCCPV